MSADTYMLFRTSLSAAEVRVALVHDPALSDLRLVDRGGLIGSHGNQVHLTVQPWHKDDSDLTDDGCDPATLMVVLTPDSWATEGWDAMQRVLAAILHLVPGDVCATNEHTAGPILLRLNGVVYVNPDGFRPENLARFGYTPECIVIGIPASTAEAAAE